MFWQLAAIATAVTLFCGSVGVTSAQEILRNQVNQGVVSIITGGIGYGHTYARLAGEMADVLDQEGDLRVLPIMGRGPVENIRDILYLRGIDVGVVHSDILTFMKSRNIFPTASRRLRYLAKLYDESFHVIAHRDIKSVYDLAGKKVVVGENAISGSTVSVRTALGILGIEAEAVYGDWKTAIKRIRSGEIAAMIYATVSGKPLIREIEPGDELHLLPLPVTDELRQTYVPTQFTSEDYPNLIPQDKAVETVQFGAIMVVYNWDPQHERYQNLAKFVTRLFDSVEALRKPPYHRRWQTFDPAAEVTGGWTRFELAQSWIEANAAERQKREQAMQKEAPLSEAEFKAFADFMRNRGNMNATSDEDLAILYRRFVDWKKQQQ